MKTILVTGCAGFIGGHVSLYLLKLGYHVIGIDNFNNYYSVETKKETLSSLLKYHNFEFRNHCISDLKALNRIDYNIDLVIHLAAIPGVVFSVKNLDLYLENNVYKYKIFLDFLAERNISKVIFASSSSVYGSQSVQSYSEELPLSPLSPYGFTKQVGEQLNYQYFIHNGINFMNLRLFSVYGNQMRPDLAIAIFVKKLISNQPIELFNNGNDLRDFTHVSDVVDAISSSIDYINKKTKCFDVFNIGNNSPIKVIDLLKIIEKTAQLKANYIKKEKRLGEPEYTSADISKAKKLLNYQPKINIYDGVQEYYNWFLKKQFIRLN